MKVNELIKELEKFDPNTEVVVPCAPYGQPDDIFSVQEIVIEQDIIDTHVKSGKYIGINLK